VSESKSRRFWALVDVAKAMHGVTDESLAAALGWSRGTLSRKRAGSMGTTLDDVADVEAVFPEVKVSMTVDVSSLTDNRRYSRTTSGSSSGEEHVA